MPAHPIARRAATGREREAFVLPEQAERAQAPGRRPEHAAARADRPPRGERREAGPDNASERGEAARDAAHDRTTQAQEQRAPKTGATEAQPGETQPVAESAFAVQQAAADGVMHMAQAALADAAGLATSQTHTAETDTADAETGTLAETLSTDMAVTASGSDVAAKVEANQPAILQASLMVAPPARDAPETSVLATSAQGVPATHQAAAAASAGEPQTATPPLDASAATPQTAAQTNGAFPGADAASTGALATDAPATDAAAPAHSAKAVRAEANSDLASEAAKTSPAQADMQADKPAQSTAEGIAGDTLAKLEQSLQPLSTPAPQRQLDALAPMPDKTPPLPEEMGLRALQGLKEFQIRLDPAELGRVDVRLEIGDDKSVSAKVVVDRVETLHLLQRDARTLERAFEQAGLKSSDAGIDISLRDPSQQQRQGNGEAWEGEGQFATRHMRAVERETDIQPITIRRTLHMGALDRSV
jgi:flagellar hook-length control protein FliK